jgi:exonuclease III
MAIELEMFYVIAVLSPLTTKNVKMYRSSKWDVELSNFVCELAKRKPIICAGLFNIAHRNSDCVVQKSSKVIIPFCVNLF